MYGGSVDALVEREGRSVPSSLEKFPEEVAAPISRSVVNHLSGLTQSDQSNTNIETLFSDKDLEWTFEVINYALKRPPDYETFRTCVTVYVDWLLLTARDKRQDKVPDPIKLRPQRYARHILSHLHHVSDSCNDPDRNLLCTHVLLQLQMICKEDNGEIASVGPHRGGTAPNTPVKKLDNNFDSGLDTSSNDSTTNGAISIVETPPDSSSGGGSAGDSTLVTSTHGLEDSTWDEILCMCLRILRSTLSQAHMKANEEKYEQILQFISNIWFTACSKHFPDPGFWKSLERIIRTYSCHPLVVQFWSSRFLDLSEKLFTLLVKNEEAGANLFCSIEKHLPDHFTSWQIVHTWYRFFYLIANPAHVTEETYLLEYRASKQGANNTESISDLRFRLYSELTHKTVRTVADTVFCFLNIPIAGWQRKSMTVYLGANETSESSGSQTGSKKKPFASKSSLLKHATSAQNSLEITGSYSSGSLKQYYAFNLDNSEGQFFIDSILNVFGEFLFQAALGSDKKVSPEFLFAQAEAISCLIRVYSLKRDGESISPRYLSILYFLIQRILRENYENSQCDVSLYVILSSCDFFTCGLQGCSIIVPEMISQTLSHIQTSKTSKAITNVSDIIIRRACFKLLLTVISRLLRFDWLNGHKCEDIVSKMNVELPNALSEETDAENISLILSALVILIKGSKCEESSSERHVSFRTITRMLIKVLDKWWESTYGPVITALGTLKCLSLARMPSKGQCRHEVVMKLCEMIKRLLMKPPPKQSKDLHSLIVSGYMTIGLWVSDQVLAEEMVLRDVLETVEFGLTGCKSVSNDSLVYKEAKAKKPPSQRVRDAAERLLHVLLKTVHHDIPPSISISHNHMHSMYSHHVSQCSALYVLDKEVIATYECKNTDSYDDCYMYLGLCGPYGRQLLHIKERLVPRNCNHSVSTIIAPPKGDFNMPQYREYLPGDQPWFPEEIDAVEKSEPEKAISSLKQAACDDEEFCALFETCLEDEEKFNSENVLEVPDLAREPVADLACNPLRKFASQMPLISPCSSLVSDCYQKERSSFVTNIEYLNKLPTKLCSFVQMFYMKALPEGVQNPVSVVLHSQKEINENSSYWRVCETLGSLQSQDEFLGNAKPEFSEVATSSLNGQEHFLSSSTLFTDLIFYHPVKSSSYGTGGTQCPKCVFRNRVTLPKSKCPFCQDQVVNPRLSHISNCSFCSSIYSDLNIFLFCLERSDDRSRLTEVFLRELSISIQCESCDKNQNTSFDYFVIAYHIQGNGLLTVHLTSNLKNIQASPLTDRAVIQPNDFAFLLNSTITNVSYDWGLENIRPHGRRREFIQKFCAKYRKNPPSGNEQFANTDSLWNLDLLNISTTREDVDEF